ncbi:MAG: hypothetical protein KME21_20740 [Desmonostoc vinosum HA7617-LM4]|jgi:hypothetical protein|nr:hypothetical protein [Desmonostoc vinosum HA7617-LM4]
MSNTSNLILDFEKLFREKLKLNNCRFRKKKQENNYEITTPSKDVFLMCIGEFPEIKLIYQPVGIRTKQTIVYERAIRSHIDFCLSNIQESNTTAVEQN